MGVPWPPLAPAREGAPDRPNTGGLAEDRRLPDGGRETAWPREHAQRGLAEVDPNLAAAPTLHSPGEVGWANTAAPKPAARDHEAAP